MEDSGRGAEASESPWSSAEVPLLAAAVGVRDGGATRVADDTAPTHKALDDVTNRGGSGGKGTHAMSLNKSTTKATAAATTTTAAAATAMTEAATAKELEANAIETTKTTIGDSDTGEVQPASLALFADSVSPGRRDPTAGFEFTCGVISVDDADGRVLAVAPGVGLREFAFDEVFEDSADQATVYERSARPLIADFINGYNGTMLVYGQTGSGKTHTMFGSGPDLGTDGVGGGESAGRGVIPRACEEVLLAAAARSAMGITSAVSVSYVEVFGQDMTDLLRGGQRVGQSRVAGQRYVLDGHAEQPVAGMHDVLAALAKGDAQKRRAATAMNDRSSRAHAVFTLSLVQTDCSTGHELRSRLCLADLGGSEKLSKSRAADGVAAVGTVPWAEYYSRRQRLTEAVNINTGLLALKRCIDALHEGQRAQRAGRPAPHVPFQDSKLTMLLSSALGGDSKTVLLVAAAQEHAHAAETVQSLRFGERCASVETRARVGANALAGMIAALSERIAAVEEEIKTTEQWETVRTVRRDEFDGRDEVVLSSRLVGAEDLRLDLETMLAERNFLSGRAAAQNASNKKVAAPAARTSRPDSAHVPMPATPADEI